MKVLLLNQCFHPDVVSTAQHLTDLAVELVGRGHQVTVIASDRGYDDPTVRFRRRETWNGINITRIRSLNVGKGSRWRRAISFAHFLAMCSSRLLLSRRFDVVVALTSPPLISWLGSLFVQLKGGRLFCWIMDLNPDEAVAAGWLKADSPAARTLEWLLRISLRNAEGIVVLDRFMKQRILEKGIPRERIAVLPPWSHDYAVHYDRAGREAFRRNHDLRDRFVVMYSGNHSPCHPLDTLLAAALRVADDRRFAFCFIGGGSEKRKVRAFAARHKLANITCLPYQPLTALAGSLSAADLHTVVMGSEFVGIVHPCKIYNILTVGVPILYIGPRESHVTDIAEETNSFPIYRADPGDVDEVVNHLRTACDGSRQGDSPAQVVSSASKQALLPRLIDILESDVRTAERTFREQLITTRTTKTIE